ncbi:tyrosine-type recombinase/integrase [Dysgonomonas sp. GY617]|nr:tyrosine-type recombinase/integrase [Dysgonomonas sp. GY617]
MAIFIQLVSFHCLHHTFATYLLNKDIPIETISGTLGHSNFKQTNIKKEGYRGHDAAPLTLVIHTSVLKDSTIQINRIRFYIKSTSTSVKEEGCSSICK